MRSAITDPKYRVGEIIKFSDGKNDLAATILNAYWSRKAKDWAYQVSIDNKIIIVWQSEDPEIIG